MAGARERSWVPPGRASVLGEAVGGGLWGGLAAREGVLVLLKPCFAAFCFTKKQAACCCMRHFGGRALGRCSCRPSPCGFAPELEQLLPPEGVKHLWREGI